VVTRASYSHFEGTVASALDFHIAALDKDGTITYVNPAWMRFAEENGANPSRAGVGVNYFQVCGGAKATAELERILSGIQAVIAGSVPHFHAEYACPSPTQNRWFALSVNPLPEPEKGVVVCHADITELKQTRDEYALILESARAILWHATLPGFRTTFTSRHAENILGFPAEAWVNNPSLWLDRIHPEDRDRVIAFTAKATEEKRSHDYEYRMIAADGHAVWLRNMVNVIVEKGRVTQVFGVSVDISDRKQAEELKSMMTRKLVLAQERERRRISRELHDDINQRLALMSIDLEQLLEKQDRLPSDVRNGLISLRGRAMELSSDIESLSHQLHSSKLEYVGLVKAIESFCREFGQKHGLEINFRKENISNTPPPEISLCLFRVLQEALSNAAKYSGVNTVQVELAQRSGQMHLKVCDSGRGFDLQEARVAVGLGLTSMQERVRLVNGSIRIQSRPMAGTTLDVVVPLDDVSQELTA